MKDTGFDNTLRVIKRFNEVYTDSDHIDAMVNNIAVTDHKIIDTTPYENSDGEWFNDESHLLTLVDDTTVLIYTCKEINDEDR